MEFYANLRRDILFRRAHGFHYQISMRARGKTEWITQTIPDDHFNDEALVKLLHFIDGKIKQQEDGEGTV